MYSGNNERGEIFFEARCSHTYGERSVGRFGRPAESQPLGSRLEAAVRRRQRGAVAQLVDEQDHLAEEDVGHERVVVPDGQQQHGRRQALRPHAVATT